MADEALATAACIVPFERLARRGVFGLEKEPPWRTDQLTKMATRLGNPSAETFEERPAFV
jgi:hypothetical protein